jgi:protoheme IX farnesyltransferase
VSLESILLFLIIFMWTPPHFWALALLRLRDYERVGVPMLPVVAGPQETRKQILLYSIALVPLAAMPTVLGFAGITYGVASVVLGAVFLWLAFDVWRIREGREADKACKRLFWFSILYLYALFAILVVEGAANRLLA